MKRTTTATVFFLFSISAHGETSSDIYCFTTPNKAATSFEIRLFNDSRTNWQGGYVKYKKSKTAISVVLNKMEFNSGQNQGPAETTTTWLEVSEGKISGEYKMISQGANIYSMQYTNYRNSKKIDFLYDPNIDSSPETGCQWP